MTEINPVEFGALKAELAAQRRDIDRIVSAELPGAHVEQRRCPKLPPKGCRPSAAPRPIGVLCARRPRVR